MRPDSYEGTREDLNRAIRRLGILEWVILGAAALFALVGGWVIALLLEDWGLPFRLTWTIASTLLFGVPGVKVLLAERADPATLPPSDSPTPPPSSPSAEPDGRR